MGFLDAFGLRTPSPAEWWQLGRVLGLSPYAHVHPFAQDMCYRRMDRSRAALGIDAAPSFTHWLSGRHRHTDVTVLQYETGSGSSTTTWTAAVARIDPPLWLGLEVRREHFLDSVFGGKDIQLGDPIIDDRLRVTSFDAARTAMLLPALDGEVRGALQFMTSLTSSYSMSISDSFVHLARTGVHTDPGEIGRMLDAAARLATWLSERRRRVPPTQGELVDLRAWERFAASHGWQLDPWRMVARGQGGGARIEIALEIEGQKGFISFLVRFEQPAPVAFHLARTTAPPFLQGIFGHDIRVGEPAFDDVYKVTGPDPGTVRAFLRRPALLSALVQAARLSTDLAVDQTGLGMRVSRGMPNEQDLAMLASIAATVTAELTGGPPPQGPYR